MVAAWRWISASKVTTVVIGGMPAARAACLVGTTQGPVLPLMKLPRIAYRKSIKPSQIIPPSRLPGLPARRHDITSWRPVYPLACRAGLCSLCYCSGF